MAFAHLHTHGEHSFLDGLSRIPDLVQRVADDLGQSAVAITDHGVVSGHLELQRACDEHGIKPIFGMEGYFCPDRFERKGYKGEFYEHMVLLAISQKGLENLWKISSLAWIEGTYRNDPRFDWELLEKYSEGLIGTSGCLSGCVTKFLVKGDEKENRRYNPDTAQRRLSRFLEIFGDRFYMELHTFGDQIQKDANNEVVALASTLGVPSIAVSDAHYLRPEDWKAHEILTAMQMGKTADDPSRYQYGPEQLCVMGEEWVRNRLSYLGESVVEEAVSNTAKIAEMAEGRIEGNDTKPVYFEDTKTDLMKLWDLALEGAERKIPKVKEDRPLSVYADRLEKELGVVGDKGFAGYFLLVADIVKWCKSDGVLVGPARGSAGGSLLAYVLDITEMDPLKHGLLFERFLDPERASIPDIDVDVPQGKRGRVKEECLQAKYGENSIATIGTLAREKPKGLMDDIGRTLEIPHSHVEEMKKIVDSIPDLEVAHIDTPWEYILGEVEGEMKPWKEKYPQAFELMDAYNGIIRHASGHAAGVVVSKESLLGRLPLRVDKNEVRTQMEAEAVEFLGFVKFDLLGLRTLDTLEQAMEMVRERNPDVDLADYNDWHYEFDKYYGDLDVYKSTWGGKTIGVFQLETPGFRQHIKWFKPKDMEDLAALISINRPGNTRAEDPDTGLKLIDLYREKREGLREATYKHPKLRDVLERTNGNFLYQEQIMEACVVLAGYSLSETDRVRKILGKKLVEKMEQEREIFIGGCKEHSGIDGDLANAIFDEMEAFAKYGFNKSHAMGYAYLAYWCMYMKYHYPREFMTALFRTNEKGSAIYQRETSRMGIQVLGPDVNEAEAGFTLTSGGIIRYGLSKIKWLGQGADLVVQEREKNGPFESVSDFVQRVSGVNKRGAEGLIGVGAMDSLMGEDDHPEWFTRQMKVLHEYWRARDDFHKSTPTVPKKLNKTTIRELTEGYDGEPSFDLDGPCLYGYPEVAEKIGADPAHCLNHTNFEHYCDDMGVADFAEMERRYLDALVTVDPLKKYMGLISQEDNYPGEAEMLVGEVARLGGLISEVRDTVTKKGRNPGSEMCHMWVELPLHTGSEEGENDAEWEYTEDRVQIVVFPDSYSKYKEDIEQGAPVLCDVSKLAPKDGYRGGLCLQSMYRLDRI